MAEFTVEYDDQAAVARLDRMTVGMRANLTSEVQAIAFDMQAEVKRKISGEVLNVVTGNLRAHILEDVVSTPSQVIGQVFTSGVKYAAVHEFGGSGFYEIVARDAKALHWLSGGMDMFRRAVNHPPAKERSYMRSTLAEMRQSIIDRMRGAVVRGAD
jgi:phage gpG-like protein